MKEPPNGRLDEHVRCHVFYVIVMMAEVGFVIILH
jgi:hypothetical protein